MEPACTVGPGVGTSRHTEEFYEVTRFGGPAGYWPGTSGSPVPSNDSRSSVAEQIGAFHLPSLRHSDQVGGSSPPGCSEGKKMRRSRVPKECLICGKVFEVKRSDALRGKGRYCSLHCLGVAGNRSRQASTPWGVPSSNPSDRTRAAGLINMRVRRGSLERPKNCQQCSRPCRPDAHHEDYTKPDQVTWLCRSCHVKRHIEIGRRRVA